MKTPAEKTEDKVVKIVSDFVLSGLNKEGVMTHEDLDSINVLSSVMQTLHGHKKTLLLLHIQGLIYNELRENFKLTYEILTEAYDIAINIKRKEISKEVNETIA